MQIADKLWLIEDRKNFYSGTPIELSENGSLERVFSKDGISIDPTTGEVKLKF